VLESDPVVLPGWVVTGTAPGRSFESHYRLERNQLVFAWEADASYGDTEHPTPAQVAAARKHAAGTARIDLETGVVETGPAETVKPEPVTPPLKELEKLAVRWQGAMGPFTCAIVMEETAAGQSLMLRLWDKATGKEFQSKELVTGKRLLVQTTLDGHHLCIRDGGTTPDEKGLGKPAREQFWTVFSLDLTSGLTKVPYEPGTQTMAVVGQRLIYAVSGPVSGAINKGLVQPRTLKAISLESGKVLWERAVGGKPLTPPVH
jgi:hypothetical protein